MAVLSYGKDNRLPAILSKIFNKFGYPYGTDATSRRKIVSDYKNLFRRSSPTHGITLPLAQAHWQRAFPACKYITQLPRWGNTTLVQWLPERRQ